MKNVRPLALFALAALIPLGAAAQTPAFRRCPNVAEAKVSPPPEPASTAPFRGAQCLELEIQSAQDPAGGGVKPYRDLTLSIAFKKAGSSVVSVTGAGYWDGSRSFKFRTALPAPEGALAMQDWTWSSGCTLGAGGPPCASALGLAKSGTVTINRYPTGSTAPDLYKKGLLQVAKQGRKVLPYLTYGDGTTPFLWLGDTAWEGPVRETSTTAAANWTSFLDNRKAKGFTVVLVAPAPTYSPSGIAGFSQAGTCTDPVPNACSTPDFAYWRRFEQLVEEANRRGLVVAVLGLIDPVDRGGLGKAFPVQYRPYPKGAEAVRFASYLAARLSGSHVVFSPGYDDQPTDATADGMTVKSVMKLVGAEIKRVAPRHLIANHLAGSAQAADYQDLEAETWLAFHLFHSGHAFNVSNACPAPAGLSRQQCAVKRARELPLGFSTRGKAAANGEGGYEYPNDPNALPPDNRYGARHTAYASVLSGAMGPTYGVKGIFAWDDLSPAVLDSPGAAKDMVVLANRLRALPWQNLKPKAYCTDATGKIVLGGPSCSLSAQDAAAKGGCDWVIELRNTKSGLSANAVATPPDRSLQVVAIPGDEGAPNAVVASLSDAAGQPIVEDIQVSVQMENLQKLPVSGRDALGNFWVVWQAENLDGDGQGVFARRYDPQGNPLGDAFLVNSFTDGDQTDPAMTADAAGHVVIAWTSHGQDGDLGGIYAQRFDLQGGRLGPEIQVHTTAAGHQAFPQVMAEPAGSFVVAWEGEGTDGDGRGVYYRRFDAAGSPQGAETRVNTTWLGDQAFSALAVATSGEITIQWAGYDTAGELMGLYDQRYQRDGTPIGGETLTVVPPAEDM
jgi:hypothetical protein